MARARPWLAARCVLAALGGGEPGDGPEWRLVGARIIADGLLAQREFICGLGEAAQGDGKRTR